MIEIPRFRSSQLVGALALSCAVMRNAPRLRRAQQAESFNCVCVDVHVVCVCVLADWKYMFVHNLTEIASSNFCVSVGEQNFKTRVYF